MGYRRFLLHISSGYLFLPVFLLFAPPYIGAVVWFSMRRSPPFRVVWLLLVSLTSMAGGGAAIRFGLERPCHSRNDILVLLGDRRCRSRRLGRTDHPDSAARVADP